jgi:hypothetical protein
MKGRLFCLSGCQVDRASVDAGRTVRRGVSGRRSKREMRHNTEGRQACRPSVLLLFLRRLRRWNGLLQDDHRHHVAVGWNGRLIAGDDSARSAGGFIVWENFDTLLVFKSARLHVMDLRWLARLEIAGGRFPDHRPAPQNHSSLRAKGATVEQRSSGWLWLFVRENPLPRHGLAQ